MNLNISKLVYCLIFSCSTVEVLEIIQDIELVTTASV